MAGGEPVELFGYRFVAKPLSRLRRVTRDFCPYWQATKPKFILYVTRLGSVAPSRDIVWFIKFSGGDIVKDKVSIPAMGTGEHINSLVIGDKFLGYTGIPYLQYIRAFMMERE
ncbi:MAG: hypothetical protein ABSG90_10930 [Dehalococcoidia bacterium]|jgi:hypothetical protein